MIKIFEELIYKNICGFNVKHNNWVLWIKMWGNDKWLGAQMVLGYRRVEGKVLGMKINQKINKWNKLKIILYYKW